MKERVKIPSWLMTYAAMSGILTLLILFFSCMSDSFFSLATLTTIANQIPALTLVAVGMTFVLIVGGIDLSVGSLMAFTSAIFATLIIDFHSSVWIALPLTILAGGICGLINGGISVFGKIPSFIVTLGMLEIARGATYLLTNSQTKFFGSRFEWISDPINNLVSPAFIIAIVVVSISQFVLVKTVVGRYYLAIGANAHAVRMSGIRTEPYIVSVFVVLGFSL